MKKIYTVHSVVPMTVEVKAKTEDGTAVTGQAEALETQLVPAGDPQSGAIKLFVTGAAVAEAKTLFVAGKSVEVTFGPGA